MSNYKIKTFNIPMKDVFAALDCVVDVEKLEVFYFRTQNLIALGIGQVMKRPTEMMDESTPGEVLMFADSFKIFEFKHGKYSESNLEEFIRDSKTSLGVTIRTLRECKAQVDTLYEKLAPDGIIRLN